MLIALPLFSAMLCSCNDEALNEKAVLSTNGLEDTYEFEAIPDGKESFTITTNVNWHLDMDGLDWLKVTPGRGLASSSAQTIVMEAIVNEDNQPRTGVMTIVAGDVTKTVTLTQKAASLVPELKFVEGVADDGIFYVDAYNIYGASLKLYSNEDWTADASDMDEWAVVGPLLGNKGRYATVSITPTETNETGSNRYGEIVFTYGEQTKKLTVCQKKFAPEITVTESGSSVSALSALSLGDSFELAVDSNAEWTVSSSQSWAVLSAEGGEYGKSVLSVTVDPNETGNVRTADIKFTNDSKTKTVKITQGNEFITVSETSFTIAKEGGNLSVKVSSNEQWTAVASEDWLTVTPATGNGNADMVIAVTAAPNDDVRTATVTVRSNDIPDIFKVVNVTQSATFVDLTTPVLFNSSQQAWNMTNNPDYASSGATGAVSGKGTGRLRSYTYPDNDMLYAQVVTPSSYGMTYIMAAEGNITFKKLWTKDAIEFHIPILNADKGSILHFDYGIMGVAYCPMYWNSEISLDGGAKWESFTTGTKTTATNGTASNTVLPGKSNVEVSYNATYTFSKAVQRSEIIIRIICVDGTMYNNGTSATEPHKNGTVRIIGADHDYDGDANKEGVVKGPKFYLK